MAIIRSLRLSLTADTQKFRKQMKSASTTLQQFRQQTVAAARSVAAVTTGAFAAAGATAALFVKQQLSQVDALAKTADKLGLTTEQLAGLNHAAELSGVSTSELENSLRTMLRGVSDAAQGTGTAKDALAELGLEAGRLNQLSSDEKFKAIADAFQQVKNQGDQVRLAFEIFGRSGTSLLNTMRGGAVAIRAAQEEAAEFGLAVSRVDASAIEQANDALTRVGAAFTGIWRQITVAVAPAITFLAESFAAFVRDALSDQNAFVGGLSNIAQALVRNFMIVTDFKLAWKQLSLVVTQSAQNILGNLEGIANFLGLEFKDGFIPLKSFKRALAEQAQQLETEVAMMEGSLQRRLDGVDNFFDSFRQGARQALPQNRPQLNSPSAELAFTEGAQDALKRLTDATKKAADNQRQPGVPSNPAATGSEDLTSSNVRELGRNIALVALKNNPQQALEREQAETLKQMLAEIRRARQEGSTAVFA